MKVTRTATTALAAVTLTLTLGACQQEQTAGGSPSVTASSSASSSSASGGGSSTTSSGTPTRTATSSASATRSTPAATTPSTTSTPDSEAQCSTSTASQAARDAAKRVPPYDPGFGDGTRWKYTADSSINGWDRCAGLSWVALPIERGTGSSPWQIALFRHGEYLGTATAKGYGFWPTITRVSDDKIKVVYHWTKEGEGTANASGTTVAYFAWDDVDHTVRMTGSTPPEN